ncbi:helix-turn-helix domain-containing protein [Rhodococcus sp. 3Y1]
MISKREQNKRDTNDRLLSAARILFSAQGFASTTVDDIAERAEVSRATFFNYFQGKDSVLRRCTVIISISLRHWWISSWNRRCRLLIGSPGFFRTLRSKRSCIRAICAW